MEVESENENREDNAELEKGRKVKVNIEKIGGMERNEGERKERRREYTKKNVLVF